MVIVLQGHLSNWVISLSFVLIFVLSFSTIDEYFIVYYFLLDLLPAENIDTINTKTMSFPFSSLSFQALTHWVAFLIIHCTNFFSECCVLPGTKEMPCTLHFLLDPARGIRCRMRDQQVVMAVIHELLTVIYANSCFYLRYSRLKQSSWLRNSFLPLTHLLEFPGQW